MRLLIYFILIISIGCRKKVCKLTRYDLSTVYIVYKGSDSFYMSLWKLPMKASDDIPLEVMDSFNKLKATGYQMSVPPSQYLTFEYADCEECDKLKNKNISSECKEYN